MTSLDNQILAKRDAIKKLTRNIQDLSVQNNIIAVRQRGQLSQVLTKLNSELQALVRSRGIRRVGQ